MSRIELFSERDLCGVCISFDCDVSNLVSKGFNDRAKSMRVTGDPWLVFEHVNYQGDFKLYRPGCYNSIPGFENKISSGRVVRGGLCDPEITVYEHVNYQGRCVTLKTNADNLGCYGFNDVISSHKVSRGAWVLYEHVHYKGNRLVALAGDHVPDYVSLCWNDKVSSIKFL